MNGTGVIFDLDGTLLDSMSVWHNVAERYLESLSVPHESGLSDRIARMSFAEGAQYIKDRYLPHYTVRQIEEDVTAIIEREYRENIPLKDGAEELLKLLSSSGIPMCVATSNSKRLACLALDRLGIYNLFASVITSDDVSLGKDSPEIYLEAVRRMGTDISNTWVVEDAPHAIATAKGAGFRVAAVQYGWVNKADISADFIIDGKRGNINLFSKINTK